MPDAARIAQATVLEVPVTIQGSKTVEGSDRREIFTEATNTILTFDNGTVLNLKSRVMPGQSVFLRNDQSGKEILCRVLEAPADGQAGSTDLEFTVHDPEFWAVPAAQPTAVDQKSEAPGQGPTETMGHVAVAVSSGESIASVGEQTPQAVPEASYVPPASSSPEISKARPTSPDEPESSPAEVAKDASDAEQLAAMMATDARGIAKRAAAAKEPKQTERNADPERSPEQRNLISGPTPRSAVQAFLARGMHKFTPGTNRIAVGILGSVLIVVLGVAWHTRHVASIHGSGLRPMIPAQSSQRALPATPPGSLPSATSAPVMMKNQQPAVAPNTDTERAKNPVPVKSDAPVAPDGRTVEDSETSARAGEADPVSSDQAEAGREKHRRPNEPNGQETTPAKIVSQSQPSFPLWASQLEVDGVVKLDALIDEKGNVVETKLLSGPRVLQHAAEGAVGLWIFEPAMSDGKPTPTHMVLTVQFQR